MVWAILLFSVISVVSATTTEECIRKIAAVDIGVVVTDPTAQERLVETQCVAQQWLKDLYGTNSAWYKEWVRKEQLKVSFQDVMSNPKLFACLKSFAEKEFNGENIAFLEATKGYKTLVADGDSAARRRDGCAIVNQFIRTSAPSQINIDDGARIAVERAFSDKCAPTSTGDVPVTVFDQAIGVIVSLISHDTFRRFNDVSKPNNLRTCPAWETAHTDMTDYNTLQQQYCADEKVAFRQGDVDRKSRTFRAILKGFGKKCATNSEYFPMELVARKSAPNPNPRVQLGRRT